MEKTILHKCSETKLLSLVLFLLQFEFVSVVMNIFSDIFSHNCFLLLLRNVVSSSFHTWCIITVLLCLESQDTEELFIYLKWIFRQFLNCTSTESVDLIFHQFLKLQKWEIQENVERKIYIYLWESHHYLLNQIWKIGTFTSNLQGCVIFWNWVIICDSNGIQSWIVSSYRS